MPDNKYSSAIIEFLSKKDNLNIRPRKLARMMGISEREYDEFRSAYKQLRDMGRLVKGARNTITLPEPADTMVGRFSATQRGFGFVSPLAPDSREDLYVPADRTFGAMSGDLVVARVVRQGKRGGRTLLSGEITEIKERASSRCVGTLELTDGFWFLLPDGRRSTTPVLVRDVPVHIGSTGVKAVVEITEYPSQAGDLPAGVIAEILGAAGEPAAEIAAIIRTYNLHESFPEAVSVQAGEAARSFDWRKAGDREDLTGLTVATIDPLTARDYDDAISLEDHGDGTVTLGVHIADVSHFVPEGTPLDEEARQRGTSVYFPRRVLPMLPEALSNGACSLQEGVERLVKSAFIRYDAGGRVIAERAVNGVIRSSARLTYEEAQAICDGLPSERAPEIKGLVAAMERLARRIERRRTDAGMLHLDLPEIELALDEAGKVTGTGPADSSYTHKIIEMFMVEANEAVARILTAAGLPVIRRIHPEPNAEAVEQLSGFVKACGQKLPKEPTRADMQRLVDAVKGLPVAYAINLAMLRSFQKATYSPEEVGHFALASSNYCHFTSPIRRYPDLVVHRMLDAPFAGRRPAEPEGGAEGLVKLAERLSARERTADAAEMELRQVLVLQHLQTKLGERFDGVVTGVAEIGLFVQLPEYHLDGVIRLQQLGDDWWEVDARRGRIRGEVSGVEYRLGQRVPVTIAKVDVPMRHLDLEPIRSAGGSPRGRSSRKRGPAPAPSEPKGDRKKRGRRP